MKKLLSQIPRHPILYSLHYAQQGRYDWNDELFPETVGRMKNSKKARAMSVLKRILLRKLGA